MAKALAGTSMQILKKAWERIAPLQLADKSWDNVGLMIDAPYPDPSRRQVLLTIDLTTAVCDEALALPSCSLVVSYHPPIFRGLKSLTMSNPIEASLLKLSARGISVFSPHTSLDAAPDGINTWLIKPFSDRAASVETLTPSDPVEGFEGAGMGKLVKMKDGMTVSEVVKAVKTHLALSHVQLATPRNAVPITSIAACAGSGASLFRGVHADLFLTGEMSHHEVLAAVAAGRSVILCNHTNTERGYLSAVLKERLKSELEGETGEEWEVLVSREDKDPLVVV